MNLFDRLARYRDYAPMLLRLVVAAILIEGTADNVFSWARMLEFRDFLAKSGFPFPLPGAITSASAQFVCGFLILFGFWTRPAAAIMVINFIAALLIAHRVGGFAPARLALCMLAASLFFLINGPGKPSVDERR